MATSMSRPDGIVIRSIDPAEIETLVRTFSGPFAFDLPDDADELADRIANSTAMFDGARCRCAFDNGTMVATLGAFSFDMTTPGGHVGCGGTTIVSVQATHRRRGILRSLMSSHLDDVRDRGEPIAALWASDSGIYGRFGYGMAIPDINVTINRSAIRPHPRAAATEPVRLVAHEDIGDTVKPVYERLRTDVPGTFGRSDDWWRIRHLVDRPDSREGATKLRCAVVGDPARGYVLYRVKSGWDDSGGTHEVKVRELFAADPAAAASLWLFVTGHDLATTVTASVASDDPVFELFAAPRHVGAKRSDAVWVRIIDLPAALAARRYPIAGTLVVQVADDLGYAGGTWRIETNGTETSVSASNEQPDLALGIEELGSAYMGWPRFGAQRMAGRVQGSMEAAAMADAMFGWHRAPWCPEVF